MKLLIDIPEEKYEWVKKNNPNADINSIVGAVANGTPLPKGHGRVIDETKITACEWDGKQMTCNAPTIIEADKGEKE